MRTMFNGVNVARKNFVQTVGLEEYSNNRDDFCFGCKGLLFHTMENKNEELRRQLNELRSQLPSV